MIEKEVRELLSFIDGNPTAYHTTASVRNILLKEGFSELLESRRWQLKPGRSYFVCRNGSSILAFRMGEQLENYSFNVAAAHTDSPCFRIKENAEIHMGRKYTKLNTEGYGGMICSTWMDRPLSVAGRVLIKENDAITSRLLTLDRDLLMIPSVAIHLDREVNQGTALKANTDLLPLLGCGTERGRFRSLLAEAAGVPEEDILSTELFLYPRAAAVLLGAEGEFVASPRLDDLQCVFGCLEGFLAAKEGGSVPILCVFNNEEVGSGTRQGADSTFLTDVLERISTALGRDWRLMAVNSFLVSADNAHAVHPAHPELSDGAERPVLNGGVVLKYNAGQKYTTDAVSGAVFREVCRAADVPVQRYSNRADLPGGSTLGNISSAHLSIPSVDIGLPQLAMHAAYEVAGSRDTALLVRAMAEYFSRSFRYLPDGSIQL